MRALGLPENAVLEATRAPVLNEIESPADRAEKTQTPLPEVAADEAQSAELTWNAYDKMTPDQQSLVDFSTGFLEAREKDLSTDYEETDLEREVHDRQMEHMFGPQGGTEAFVPETLAYLKQINFDSAGQDIDDYLSLDRIPGLDELEGFAAAKGKPLVAGATSELEAKRIYAAQQGKNNQDLITAQAIKGSQKAIKKAMLDAEAVQSSWEGTLAAGRRDDVSLLGGTVPAPEFTAGFPYKILPEDGSYAPPGLQPGTEETLNAIRKSNALNAMYVTLANKQAPIEAFWDLVAHYKLDDKDLDEVYAYFDKRVKDELRWGIPKDDRGNWRRSPEELRSWIGLED